MTVKIVFDIFQGLAILETHNIVHCDIKPENVCLKFNSDGSHTAKIIDFGSCKTPKDKMNYIGLTPEYLPPSINQFLCLAMQKKLTQSTVHPRLTVKDDVWGAGMVTLYIEKGEHPVIKHFTGHQDYPRDQNVMTLRVEVMKKTAELRNPLPTYFNTNKPVLDYLLANVLSVDPNLRWTSSAAVTFLKGNKHTNCLVLLFFYNIDTHKQWTVRHTDTHQHWSVRHTDTHKQCIIRHTDNDTNN
uniref:Protein kinase domain-containing protein n=1 Tax=Biomphalaria glabrata TaxID=6526 RepID=A0A2C9LTA5_BIOGL